MLPVAEGACCELLSELRLICDLFHIVGRATAILPIIPISLRVSSVGGRFHHPTSLLSLHFLYYIITWISIVTRNMHTRMHKAYYCHYKSLVKRSEGLNDDDNGCKFG